MQGKNDRLALVWDGHGKLLAYGSQRRLLASCFRTSWRSCYAPFSFLSAMYFTGDNKKPLHNETERQSAQSFYVKVYYKYVYSIFMLE